ncbi:putative DnaJ chaperone protein [Trypanosoma cruzi]|nr:putative DnaJ chaperone protein [Trypanosoma cruzi]
MTDYYQSLELPRDATQEQIRRNYRQLALRFHPDRRDRRGRRGSRRYSRRTRCFRIPKRGKYTTGLEPAFVDNPVSEVLILQLGGRWILCIMACIPFLVASLVVIFTAFLVAYVEGRLVARDAHSVNDHSQAYWNYVKVFSPLFIVDIIIGVPTLVAFFVSMCTLRVGVFLWTLIVLSLIVLTVLVPVAKDANDMTSLRGGNNFHSWRRWLAPLYVVGGVVNSIGHHYKAPHEAKA